MLKISTKLINLSNYIAACNSYEALGVAPSVYDRLRKARITVEQMIEGDTPVYGLNTGLGGNLDYRIPKDEIPAFQMQLLRGRAVAAGEPLPERTGRAITLARILSAAIGVSGISVETFDHLVQVFNSGLSPVVPCHGSIGAGDLVQNACWALAILGEGKLWYNGEQVDAVQALHKAGITIPTLQPKDALALNNHSGLTVAVSASALHEAKRALEMIKAATVLSFEGYGANQSVLQDQLHKLRNAPGQSECAQWMREQLEGSEHDPRRVQDPLSFRTVPAVTGAAQHLLDQAISVWEDEANGSSDSPVAANSENMLSTINFHSPALALALEAVSLSLAGVANASVQRMQKLMNPDLSGLPKYLTPIGNGSAGFVPTQKTAASLLAEIRRHAMPAILDAVPVSDSVEDMAPMTSLAARKLTQQTESLKLLSGLEALVSCQALDLRAPAKTSKLAGSFRTALRQTVPMLSEDRAISSDIETATNTLATYCELASQPN